MNTLGNIGIYKSQAKSFIKKINLTTSLADELFSEKPSLDGKEVVVLKVANFGGGIVLAEIIYRSDYDENCNIKNHNIEIHKTHDKSIIRDFYLTSPVADEMFASKPIMNGKEVVVLQVVKVNDKDKVFVEVVYKSDYDEKL